MMFPAKKIKLTVCLGLLLAALTGTVTHAQSQNTPPVLTLPPAMAAICLPGEGLIFMHDATAVDDGLPEGEALRVSWEQLSGPSIVAFVDRSQIKALICVKRAGEYQFRMLADDGEFLVSMDVGATVLPPPPVNPVAR